MRYTDRLAEAGIEPSVGSLVIPVATALVKRSSGASRRRWFNGKRR